jgi:hypothetical protein
MDYYYQPLPELDISHAYLHWDPRSTANDFVCEMMAGKEASYIKEGPLDSKK